MAAFDAASLSEGEQRFLQSLSDLGVRYLVVGMSAALLQGARGATEDIDLWFQDLSDPLIGEAARRSGGFWVTRSEPPLLGGMGERFDVVTTMSGLPDFSEEYARAKEFSVDGVALKVLPLERIIVSKRAANRSKDQVALRNLELALRLLGR
jgi:predicted nucleotidyltransferase